MGFFSWRQLFGRKSESSRRSAKSVRKRFWKPSLEKLEDRVAPAIAVWTGADASNNDNWSDAKNWTILNGQSGQVAPKAGDDLSFQSGPSGAALTSHNDLAAGTRFNSITISGSGYSLTGNSITLTNIASGNTLVGNASSDTIAFNIQLGGSSGGLQTVSVGLGDTLTLSGGLSGANGVSLSKTGSGTLILGADNSGFNGSMAVTSGTLEITNAKALGNSAAGYATVLTNALLEVSNVTGSIAENVKLTGAGTDNSSGALQNIAGNNTWSGNIELDGETTLGASASTMLTISGTITDIGGGYNLSKEGAGTIALAGANTYRGQTIINNGILQVQNAQALGDPNGSTANTLVGATIVNSTPSETGTLQLDDPTGVGFTVQNEWLVLNGSGFNSVGALDNLNGDNTWASDIYLGSPAPNGSSVEIGAEVTGPKKQLTTLTISGVIHNDIDNQTVYPWSKIGPGRVSLTTVANKYDGTTYVDQGYLRIEDSQSLGTLKGGTVVYNGATLEMYADPNHTDSVTGPGGNLSVIESLTIYGNGVKGNAGALDSIQGINTWTGGVNLAGGSAAIGVEPDPNASSTNAYFTKDYSLTITSNMTGGSLIKLGQGQLILPGANSYSGNTTIVSGWITIENNNSLGGFKSYLGPTVQATVRIDTNAALMLNAVNGAISLPEEFILGGTGISHPFSLINGQGAIENIQGDNTITGTIQLEGTAGIGTERVFTDKNGNLLASKLTLTGTIEDYTGTLSYNQSAAGGSQESDVFYDTGATSGKVNISYDMQNIPDDLQVFYEGKQLYDTGYISGQGNITVNYGPGSSTQVEIIMDQGGGPPGTAWSYSLSITASNQPNGLVKLGTQMLDIQGAGTYTGAVDIQAGVLLDQNNTGLGAANGGTVTVESGAALELYNSMPAENGGIAGGLQILGRNLVLNGIGNTILTGDPNPLDPSTLNPSWSGSSPPGIISPLTVLDSDNVWGGNVTFNTASILDIEPSTRLTINGVIDGSSTASLTKIGTGELVLGGANTYQGVTYVNQGFLTVANYLGLGSPVNGTVVSNGATIQLENNITISGESLTLQGTGAGTSANVTPFWFQQGPAPILAGQAPGKGNTTGRVTGVAADPTDPKVEYVSTADGGAWKTIDGGVTWTQLFDTATDANGNLLPIYAGAIAVAPSNPSIIYLGTGEADNATDSYYGTGVYKSTDAGKTWTLLGGSSNPLLGLAVSQIVVDPSNPNLIYVGTSNMAGGLTTTPTAGVFRYDGRGWFNLTNVVSYDRANTPSPNNNDSSGNPIDPPKTPGPNDDYTISFPFTQNGTVPSASWSSIALVGGELYAALGTYTGSTESESLNGGLATSSVLNAVFHCDNPTSNAPVWWIGTGDNTTKNPLDLRDSKEFPASSSNGNIKITAGGTVYAAITQVPPLTGNLSLLQIEESTDGGQTWAKVSAEPADYMDDQGQYASAIVTVDGTTVYVAGSDTGTDTNYVLVTTDGGSTWKDISSKGPNTAIHALWIDASNRLLAATDGGVWLYDPSTSTWTDINGNLAISQLLGVAVDPTASGVAGAGGMYTGTETSSSVLSWTSSSVTNSDVGDNSSLVQINPLSPNIYYSIQNNTLYESTKYGAPGTWTALLVGVNWIAPINVESSSRIVVGTSGGVYQSVNGGASWTQLNPITGAGFLFAPVTAVDTATNQGTYQTDGSFTDVTDQGATNYDPGTIWAIANGSVYLTRDMGLFWVKRGTGLPSSLSAIAVDPTNSSTAYVTSNADTGTKSGRVFVTSNGGQSWTNITGTGKTALPDAPVWSVVVDPRTGSIYVGTSLGVYVTTRANGSSTVWTRVGAGMPDVQVRYMTLDQITNTLTVATYGRSVFQMTLDDAPVSSGALRAVSGTATWTGPITLMGNTTISASGTQVMQNGISTATLNLVGIVSDGGNNYGLTKIGNGTVILSGANTYTGATDIQHGVLVANNLQALGLASAVGASVEAGAALEIESNVNSVALTLNGNGISYNGFNSGALRSINGINTYTGNITLNSSSTIGVDSGSVLTLTGSISDGSSSYSLSKQLTGNLVLSGTNTYHGGTVIYQGQVEITNGQALGSAGGTTTVEDGAQLALQAPVIGSSTIPFTISGQTLILAGSGIFNTGALLNNRGNNVWNGNITLTSFANPSGYPATNLVSQVVIDVARSSDTLTVTGTINEKQGTTGPNAFGIGKAGSGILLLTQQDTFSGSSIVQAGTLVISDSGALGTTGDVTVSAGATLDLKADPTHNDSVTGVGGNLNVQDHALTLSGNGVSNTGALLNEAGNNTWGGTVSLQAASSISVLGSSSLTINNSISGNTGNTLSKIGTGTLYLSGANSYQGQTLVKAGILNISTNANALSPNSAGTVVSSGATLQLQGGTSSFNSLSIGTPLTLSGAGYNNLGALDNLAGTDTWTGAITLAGDTTISVDADSLTVSGVIGQSSTGYKLDKRGAGTLILSSAETYTGKTTVSAGTLQVDGSGTIKAVSLDGGTLAGTGTVGAITDTANGGTIDAGDGASSPGTLNVNGSMTLDSNVTVYAQLNGNSLSPTQQYNQINVTGAVTLGGAKLTGNVPNTFTPSIGSSTFTILQVNGAGNSISGTFNPSPNVIFNNYEFSETEPSSTSVVLTRIAGETTTTITSSPSSSYYGQSVTFTATVAPIPGLTGTLKGSVDFKSGSTDLGSATLSNGSASISYSLLPVGNDTITATFTDTDGNFAGSVGTFVQTVHQAATTTSLALKSGNPNPSDYGTALTFIATISVTAPGVGPADGSVNFYDGTVDSQHLLGSATVTTSTEQATFNMGGTQLNAGSHNILAVYQGNTNYASSQSAQLAQTVNQIASTTSNVTTAWTPSSTPPVSGQAVTLSVTVSGAAGTPTQTVEFYDNNGTTDLGSAKLSAGTATLTVYLGAGSHSLTASYGGDVNFKTSQSASATSLTVNKDTASATVVTSKGNATYGVTVITATLAADAPGSGTPTGNVTFQVTPQGGTAFTETDALTNGVATLQDVLDVGSYSITILSYDGDSNFTFGASNTIAQTVTPASTSTSNVVATFTGSSTPVSGQAITLNSKVSSSFGTPGSTVEFFDGSKDLGAGTLDSSGNATLQLTTLLAGTHNFTASYSGSLDYTASNTAKSVALIINKAATSTTVTLDSGSKNPSTYGQSETFDVTVSVSSPGSGTPSGSVFFYYNQVDAAHKLASGTLSGGSTDSTSFTLGATQLPPGSYNIIAVYQGDSAYLTSTSASYAQTIKKADSTTSIVSATWTNSPTTPVATQPVTLSATVTTPVGSPTGTVEFYDGTTDLGPGSLSNGIATITVTTLGAGNHSFSATYNGDVDFNTSSSSSTDKLTVNKDTASLVVASTRANAAYGQDTITATVSADAPGVGYATGTVTFSIVDANNNTTTETDKLVNGVATLQKLLDVGVYTVTAAYNGDSNFDFSGMANTINQTVTQATTSVKVSADNTSPYYGQQVTFTVSVAPQYAGMPQGTVDIVIDNTTVASGLALVNGSVTYQTSSLSVAASPHTIQANFNDTDGDFSNNSGSMSETVQAATTSTVVALGSGSTSPSNYGDPVTFVATVNVTAGSGTPTGNVVFYIGSISNANKIGSSALNQLSPDQATLTTSALVGGTDKIIAVYQGDGNYATSISTNLSQVVKPAATTTSTVTASWNGSPSDPVAAQPVTLTATVSSSKGTPGGTIEFYDGSFDLGQGSLNGSGTATLLVTSLGAGSHSLTASYNASQNYSTSTSSTGTALTVDPASTILSLTSSNQSAVYGTATISATVTAKSPSLGTPNGQVTFTVVSAAGTYTETDTLNNGVAVLQKVLDVGTYTISASYAGTTSYLASSTSAINQVITPAGTSTTVTSSSNPASANQPITFVVQVGAQAGTPPSGYASLYIDGSLVAYVAITNGVGSVTVGLSASSSPHSVVASFTPASGNYSGSSGQLAGGQTVLSPSSQPSSGSGSSGSGTSAYDNALIQDTYLLMLDLAIMSMYGSNSQTEMFAYALVLAIETNPLYGTTEGNNDMNIGYAEALALLPYLIYG